MHSEKDDVQSFGKWARETFQKQGSSLDYQAEDRLPVVRYTDLERQVGNRGLQDRSVRASMQSKFDKIVKPGSLSDLKVELTPQLRSEIWKAFTEGLGALEPGARGKTIQRLLDAPDEVYKTFLDKFVWFPGGEQVAKNQNIEGVLLLLSQSNNEISYRFLTEFHRDLDLSNPAHRAIVLGFAEESLNDFDSGKISRINTSPFATMQDLPELSPRGTEIARRAARVTFSPGTVSNTVLYGELMLIKHGIRPDGSGFPMIESILSGRGDDYVMNELGLALSAGGAKLRDPERSSLARAVLASAPKQQFGKAKVQFLKDVPEVLWPRAKEYGEGAGIRWLDFVAASDEPLRTHRDLDVLLRLLGYSSKWESPSNALWVEYTHPSYGRIYLDNLAYAFRTENQRNHFTHGEIAKLRDHLVNGKKELLYVNFGH